MPTKVLITSATIADEALEFLRHRGAEWSQVPVTTPVDEFLEFVTGESYDAIVSRTVKITGEIMDAMPRLKVIAKHGAGIDNIDVEAATDRRIPVLSTRGGNARSVAEHALALILALTKRLMALDAGLRAGRWEKPAFLGAEIAEKHLGLIGFGPIGRRTAELARAFDMNVSVYDPYVAESDLPAGVRRHEGLDDLLSAADVVSLHCPLTDETRGMIGSAQLGRMKSTAYLVNTARGALVDEAALVESLERGTIAGAALDCFSEEPPAADSVLWSAPNLLATPHVGGVTAEAFRRVGVEAVRNMFAVLDGDAVDPVFLVNPSVLSRKTGKR
ncbi:MAG TPA: hydroxyacid dehydrogenase [Rhodospirillales bacterium]|nr:hydroxyacid dehydrogenase [Rhodospirillales bacterium]